MAAPSAKKASRHGTRRGKISQAAAADRCDLYERSVQNPGDEVSFVAQTFKRLRKRPALTLREDFSGTAAFSRQWVTSQRERVAYAVDLDQDALTWCQTNRLTTLKPQQAQRLHLVHANVLECDVPRVDATVAFNFSYWIFKDRATLLAYFRKVRASLVDDGLFFLDIWGGPGVQEDDQDLHEDDEFTWVWQWGKYNPITSEILCHIHFRFADRSRIDRAYTYDWRVWTIQELRDIALEAGFRALRCFGDELDDDGEETGRHVELHELAGFETWWVYLVAER